MTETQKATENLPRSAYHPHVAVRMEITGTSRAKQSFRDECDINTIMAKYQKTGLITHVSKYGGQYGDLLNSVDYQTALNKTMEAGEAFQSLPSGIREKFENDPGQFLAFVEDPENEAEMIEMGLATSKPAPETGNAPGEGETPPTFPEGMDPSKNQSKEPD